MEMTDRTLWMLLDSRLRGNDGVEVQRTVDEGN